MCGCILVHPVSSCFGRLCGTLAELDDHVLICMVGFVQGIGTINKKRTKYRIKVQLPHLGQSTGPSIHINGTLAPLVFAVTMRSKATNYAPLRTCSCTPRIPSSENLTGDTNLKITLFCKLNEDSAYSVT